MEHQSEENRFPDCPDAPWGASLGAEDATFTSRIEERTTVSPRDQFDRLFDVWKEVPPASGREPFPL